MTVPLWKSPEAEPTGSGVGWKTGPCFSVTGGPGSSVGKNPLGANPVMMTNKPKGPQAIKHVMCVVVFSNIPHCRVSRGPDGHHCLWMLFVGASQPEDKGMALGLPKVHPGRGHCLEEKWADRAKPAPVPSGPGVHGACCQDGRGCGVVPGLQSLESRGEV